MAQRQCPKARQSALSALFGLSTITWSRIERGERRPPLEQAVKLERAGVCEATDWFEPPQALPLTTVETKLRAKPEPHDENFLTSGGFAKVTM
ncbi:helix-turn-helix transcriptional regulator [Novosphingobium sp. ST904]|uniref:helix-turn-helix domain-containing protein n=1 Tax=Novosphingobium sp. ST904 TaxID=1684385 RepID=UPI0006C8A8D5|nr:helix-turn-helix transcriptional regulator [Novosphingobium sp. ST904]KPH59170.1 hypothetical protein ADT71_23790 [Novosphingobium sp. ST904]